MTPRKMNLVVILVVLILTSGFAGGLFVPGLKRAAAREATLKEAVRQAQQDQLAIGDMSELYSSIVDLDARLKPFRESLPTERHFGEFLGDLTQYLKEAQIKDYVLLPGPPEVLGPEELPPTLVSASDTGLLSVNLSFESTYQQLFELIDRIERMPRLALVESLKLTNSETTIGRLSVKMLVHTYHRPR